MSVAIYSTFKYALLVKLCDQSNENENKNIIKIYRKVCNNNRKNWNKVKTEIAT